MGRNPNDIGLGRSIPLATLREDLRTCNRIANRFPPHERERVKAFLYRAGLKLRWTAIGNRLGTSAKIAYHWGQEGRRIVDEEMEYGDRMDPEALEALVRCHDG